MTGTAFDVVDVTPDAPLWSEERRRSVGASEVAAVMGLSAYGVTPLDVFKHKQGIDRDFDPILAFIGHASEDIIHRWVADYSGIGVDLEAGFMARSREWPFLHASFDRVANHPFTTVQFKTASAWAGHHWDEGIPTDIRVQVQAEMAVAGTARALVVVWIGGREFRSFWETRDDSFINEYMIPALRDFWESKVLAGVAPLPSTVAEVNATPTERVEVELSESAFEALERITVLSSDIAAQSEERDSLKVALAQYTGSADMLTFEGRKVATWRQQAGRVGFDKKGFEAVYPDLAAEFTTVGQPFRVLRRIKQKETS